MIIENLPFDKYEVEPCPLTQYILSRKQASTCWQVRYLMKNNNFPMSILYTVVVQDLSKFYSISFTTAYHFFYFFTFSV